ncbi:MAG TPA: serpin family protein [Anaerolineae bacterium]
MSKYAVYLVAACVLLSQAACQSFSNSIGGAPAVGEVKSQKERLTAATPSGDVARLVAGNNAFAFDLYRGLSAAPGNLFYSPHSISSALAMTYAGARGATAQQMAQALHFELAGDSLHPAFNSLDLELATRGEGAKGKDGKGFRLRTVNALWGQKGYQFLPGFLDVLAENYGAGMRLLDFSAAEQSRQTINAWVSDQTESRIKDLIAKGMLDAATRLVLTNAIYFNAAWAEAFSAEQTRDGTFNLLDGGKVTVPMMNRTEFFSYAKGEGYQAVALPYDKRELSMLIVMPAAGQWNIFESSLDAKRVEVIVKSLDNKRVVLSMPKFKVETSYQLTETLRGLGMRDAFEPGLADFSGMDGTRNLFIGQVIHKAFVAVDEAGTEAAAATAVIMPTGARIEQPVVLNLDRPFFFLIRDNATGAILFVGRVMNPAP